MGRFYDLIQQHIDAQPYEVSESAVARRLGVNRQTVTKWKLLRSLPDKRHIQAVADLAGVPYAVALAAVLEDIGYAHRDPEPPPAETPRRKLG